MKTRFLNCCCVALVLFTSCTTGKLYQSTVSGSSINQLDYLQPVSNIIYVEKGNKGVINDSLSLKSELFIESVLKDQSKELSIPLDYKVKTISSDDRAFIEEEMTAMVEFLEDGRADFYFLELSDMMLDFMHDNDTEYLLGTVVYGHVRRKGNYTGQIFKSIGIGILTLGMYYPIPIKSSSSIYFLILDAKNKNLAFYRRSYIQDKSPFDEEVVKKQIYKLFKGYFYE